MSVLWYTIGGVLIAGVIVLLPVLKTVNRVAPFAYPNARIRAMRARLVHKEEFEEFASRPYADVLYELRERIPPLSKLGTDISFARIDKALREDLVDSLLLVKRISPQQTKGFIQAIISKYDIQVIESIVRSQKARINVKYDILHATEVFSPSFIAKQNITLEDLKNELTGTVYAEILSKYETDIKKHQYEKFETELDLLYFARVLSSAKTQDAKTYAKDLIDAHNISHQLKGMDAIIPGGRIQVEDLHGKSPEQIIAIAAQAGITLKGNTPQHIEKSMQEHIKNHAKGLLAKDPLSEATIVGFIGLKTITTRNTVILLKLLAHGFDAEKIREVLVL